MEYLSHTQNVLAECKQVFKEVMYFFQMLLSFWSITAITLFSILEIMLVLLRNSSIICGGRAEPKPQLSSPFFESNR